MSVAVTIADILPAFPSFRVAVVIAEDLAIEPRRSPKLDALIAAREQAARERWAGMELAQIPGVAAWRAAYRAFGVKQTRYRSSVERLVKNTLAGRALPQINSFVDLYNAVSISHVMPLGADDLDRISPPLAFRYARAGDTFVDMAGTGEEGEAGAQPDAEGQALKPGEVVYTDAAHVLCRRWNWRQDARSLISAQTRRAVVTVQANGWGDLEAAAHDLVALIREHCGGACRLAVADTGRPDTSV